MAEMTDQNFVAAGGATQASGQQSEAQQLLQTFWPRQLQGIRVMNPADFKVQELPLARIKKIMKLDEDVKMISAEAPLLFAKACEIFISELTLRAWVHTEDNKRRTLQRNDIAMAITKFDQFDFLIDIVPRDELKPPKRQEEVRQAVMAPDQVQYYFQLAQQHVQMQQPQQQPQQQAVGQIQPQPQTAQPVQSQIISQPQQVGSTFPQNTPSPLQPPAAQPQIISPQPQQIVVQQSPIQQQVQTQVQTQVQSQVQTQPAAVSVNTAPVMSSSADVSQTTSVPQVIQVQTGPGQQQGIQTIMVQQTDPNTGQIQHIPVQVQGGQLQYIRLAQPQQQQQQQQPQQQQQQQQQQPQQGQLVQQIAVPAGQQQHQQQQQQQQQQQFTQFTADGQQYLLQQVNIPTSGAPTPQQIFVAQSSPSGGTAGTQQTALIQQDGQQQDQQQQT
ncbi:NFYC [Branchiostoma lanceolatum]|uniref:Nuclear transcription factor Y subunit gamma n=1 Tax=Branchiostoma lanceolatum TaxID=7740 RepID=A0A8J9ZK92_BRALA|nr:NFYC [Branchiostoma lanceolatum]